MIAMTPPIIIPIPHPWALPLRFPAAGRRYATPYNTAPRTKRKIASIPIIEAIPARSPQMVDCTLVAATLACAERRGIEDAEKPTPIRNA